MARICALAGLAAVTLAALVNAPEASAQELDPTTDRGVVQTVAPPRLVVRALDGSELEFVVDDSTRVVLNGVRARFAAIRPGFVAEVLHRGSGRAMRIRAFGRFAGVEHGVIVSAARRELLLERADGGQIAIPLTRRTHVRRGGVVVGRWALRPGPRATVLLARDGSARVIMLRRQRV